MAGAPSVGSPGAHGAALGLVQAQLQRLSESPNWEYRACKSGSLSFRTALLMCSLQPMRRAVLAMAAATKVNPSNRSLLCACKALFGVFIYLFHPLW